MLNVTIITVPATPLGPQIFVRMDGRPSLKGIVINK